MFIKPRASILVLLCFSINLFISETCSAKHLIEFHNEKIKALYKNGQYSEAMKEAQLALGNRKQSSNSIELANNLEDLGNSILFED